MLHLVASCSHVELHSNCHGTIIRGGENAEQEENISNTLRLTTELSADVSNERCKTVTPIESISHNGVIKRASGFDEVVRGVKSFRSTGFIDHSANI